MKSTNYALSLDYPLYIYIDIYIFVLNLISILQKVNRNYSKF